MRRRTAAKGVTGIAKQLVFFVPGEIARASFAFSEVHFAARFHERPDRICLGPLPKLRHDEDGGRQDRSRRMVGAFTSSRRLRSKSISVEAVILASATP